MDDRLDAVLDQDVIEPLDLGQVADDEPLGRHRLAMPQRQVVVDPDVMAARQEQLDGMTADVAGAAGDENSHEY